MNQDVIPEKCARRGCKTKGKIRRGDFLICTRCSKHFHKRKECSDMTIKAVKVLQREQWVCPNCEEDEIEEEDNIEVEEGQ